MSTRDSPTVEIYIKVILVFPYIYEMIAIYIWLPYNLTEIWKQKTLYQLIFITLCNTYVLLNVLFIHFFSLKSRFFFVVCGLIDLLVFFVRAPFSQIYLEFIIVVVTNSRLVRITLFYLPIYIFYVQVRKIKSREVKRCTQDSIANYTRAVTS